MGGQPMKNHPLNSTYCAYDVAALLQAESPSNCNTTRLELISSCVAL